MQDQIQLLQSQPRFRAPFLQPYKYAGESYGWPSTLIEAEPLDRFRYQWLI
jgi:hypothetical protein